MLLVDYNWFMFTVLKPTAYKYGLNNGTSRKINFAPIDLKIYHVVLNFVKIWLLRVLHNSYLRILEAYIGFYIALWYTVDFYEPLSINIDRKIDFVHFLPTDWPQLENKRTIVSFCQCSIFWKKFAKTDFAPIELKIYFRLCWILWGFDCFASCTTATWEF